MAPHIFLLEALEAGATEVAVMELMDMAVQAHPEVVQEVQEVLRLLVTGTPVLQGAQKKGVKVPE